MEGAKLMFEFALDYNPRDVSSLNRFVGFRV